MTTPDILHLNPETLKSSSLQDYYFLKVIDERPGTDSSSIIEAVADLGQQLFGPLGRSLSQTQLSGEGEMLRLLEYGYIRNSGFRYYITPHGKGYRNAIKEHALEKERALIV